jgi:hypothetical protein
VERRKIRVSFWWLHLALRSKQFLHGGTYKPGRTNVGRQGQIEEEEHTTLSLYLHELIDLGASRDLEYTQLVENHETFEKPPQDALMGGWIDQTLNLIVRLPST